MSLTAFGDQPEPNRSEEPATDGIGAEALHDRLDLLVGQVGVVALAVVPHAHDGSVQDVEHVADMDRRPVPARAVGLCVDGPVGRLGELPLVVEVGDDARIGPEDPRGGVDVSSDEPLQVCEAVDVDGARDVVHGDEQCACHDAILLSGWLEQVFAMFHGDVVEVDDAPGMPSGVFERGAEQGASNVIDSLPVPRHLMRAAGALEFRVAVAPAWARLRVCDELELARHLHDDVFPHDADTSVPAGGVELAQSRRLPLRDVADEEHAAMHERDLSRPYGQAAAEQSRKRRRRVRLAQRAGACEERRCARPVGARRDCRALERFLRREKRQDLAYALDHGERLADDEDALAGDDRLLCTSARLRLVRRRRRFQQSGWGVEFPRPQVGKRAQTHDALPVGVGHLLEAAAEQVEADIVRIPRVSEDAAGAVEKAPVERQLADEERLSGQLDLPGRREDGCADGKREMAPALRDVRRREVDEDVAVGPREARGEHGAAHDGGELDCGRVAVADDVERRQALGDGGLDAVSLTRRWLASPPTSV